MKNKYYTPEIEEFHVGFKYESKNVDTKNWDKELVGDVEDLSECHHGLSIEGLLTAEYIRVKYLDKEDIESLGFIKWADRENYDLGEYQLHKNNNLNISIYDGVANLIFIGDIKNKSELKKLLKQLNIL